MAREIPYGERLETGFRMLSASHSDDLDGTESDGSRSLDERDMRDMGHWDYRRGWVKAKLPDN